MYNLLKYSKSYKKKQQVVCGIIRDEPSNPLSSFSASFKYNTSITGNTFNLGVGEAVYDANKVGKMKLIFWYH